MDQRKIPRPSVKVAQHIRKVVSESTVYKDSTMDKTDACTTPERKEDLLKGVDIPDFNDTLEEVDFILSLGLKLKEEGKVNFSTPPVITTPSGRIHRSRHDTESADMSVLMTATAQSSPKLSRLQTKSSARRISKVFSPIKFDGPTPTCRNNVFRENFMSPTIK